MRLLAVASFGAALTVGAAPANASVTLGQLAPAADTTTGFGDNFDFAQTGVTSGASYTVPGTGTITSWSHNARATATGQTLTMKVFRKIAEPNVYMVVGHDGPRPIDAGLINTFPAAIPVKPGDLLGLHTTHPMLRCRFNVDPKDTFVSSGPDPMGLGDGQSASFLSEMGSRLNISAVFEPSNTVTVGKTKFNKKKGTATLNLTLPNPGELTGSGKGVKAAGAATTSKSIPAPGPATLLIKAKGKKKQKLNETGKVKVKVVITYTPTNGAPGTQSLKLKLKRKL